MKISQSVPHVTSSSFASSFVSVALCKFTFEIGGVPLPCGHWRAIGIPLGLLW